MKTIEVLIVEGRPDGDFYFCYQYGPFSCGVGEKLYVTSQGVWYTLLRRLLDDRRLAIRAFFLGAKSL